MTNQRRQFLIGVVLLLFFSAFPAYPQTQLRPLGNLAVYDGDGKKVGSVTQIRGGSIRWGADVAFATERTWFLLTFFATGVTGNDDSLAYQSTDCSGDPFFLGDSLRAIRVVPYSAVRNGMVYTATLGTWQRITIRSVFRDVLTNQVCERFTFEAEAQPAVPTIDISTRFKPPFSIH